MRAESLQELPPKQIPARVWRLLQQSVRSSSLSLKIARSPENVGKRALVLTEKGQRCLIRRSFAGNHTSRALLPLYSPRGLELSRLKSIADRPEAVAPVEPVISHLDFRRSHLPSRRAF